MSKTDTKPKEIAVIHLLLPTQDQVYAALSCCDVCTHSSSAVAGGRYCVLRGIDVRPLNVCGQWELDPPRRQRAHSR